MSSVSYETIFSDFLGNTTDFDIASLNISDAYEMMTEYLHKGLKNTYIRELFSSITYDDEIQTLLFELNHIVSEEQDIEFVVNIIAKAMVIEWLKPQVRSQLYIKQFIGTKETKYYAQSPHLTAINNMYKDVKQELEKEIKDRNTYHNQYLGDK